LVGLAAFYGLESLARRSGPHAASARDRRDRAGQVFWLHLAAYAVFNVLIGYLLLDRDEPGLFGLLTYAVAMAMHFVVADQGLREQFHPAYDRWGRWILAVAPLLGWLLAVWVDVAPLAVSALFAFLAGGIILNVLKEELPERRHSHFSAFVLGAGVYAAVLLAAD
jgi:undecaprenyl pyrophosphate phosphatase UppP